MKPQDRVAPKIEFPRPPDVRQCYVPRMMLRSAPRLRRGAPLIRGLIHGANRHCGMVQRTRPGIHAATRMLGGMDSGPAPSGASTMCSCTSENDGNGIAPKIELPKCNQRRVYCPVPRAKIFGFTRRANHLYKPAPSRLAERGVGHRHERWAGCGGREVRTRRMRIARGRRSRVGPAPPILKFLQNLPRACTGTSKSKAALESKISYCP